MPDWLWLLTQIVLVFGSAWCLLCAGFYCWLVWVFARQGRNRTQDMEPRTRW